MILNPETVAQLGDDDPAKAYRAHQKLLEAVSQVTKPGNRGEQTAAASVLAEELQAKTKTEGKDGKPGEEKPKHSAKVRRQVAQLLAQVADDTQVPALTSAMEDLETREAARWALNRIPTPAATAAMVSALDQIGPEFRIGLINALGMRRAPDVVTALHRQASDPDEEVRMAAVEALANFPEASSDDVIVAAGRSGSSRSKSRAYKARIRLAETLRLAGNKDAAVSIYRSVLADEADKPQKKAAQLAIEQLT